MRDWSAYREQIRQGRLAVEGSEVLGPGTVSLEDAWLGLRTHSGVALERLSERQLSLTRAWASRGWGVTQADAFRLTAEGWLLLDRLSVEIASA